MLLQAAPEATPALGPPMARDHLSCVLPLFQPALSCWPLPLLNSVDAMASFVVPQNALHFNKKIYFNQLTCMSSSLIVPLCQGAGPVRGCDDCAMATSPVVGGQDARWECDCSAGTSATAGWPGAAVTHFHPWPAGSPLWVLHGTMNGSSVAGAVHPLGVVAGVPKAQMAVRDSRMCCKGVHYSGHG